MGSSQLVCEGEPQGEGALWQGKRVINPAMKSIIAGVRLYTLGEQYMANVGVESRGIWLRSRERENFDHQFNFTLYLVQCHIRQILFVREVELGKCYAKKELFSSARPSI